MIFIHVYHVLRNFDCFSKRELSFTRRLEYAMENGQVFYRLGDPKISLRNDFRVYRARIFGTINHQPLFNVAQPGEL